MLRINWVILNQKQSLKIKTTNFEFKIKILSIDVNQFCNCYFDEKKIHYDFGFGQVYRSKQNFIKNNYLISIKIPLFSYSISLVLIFNIELAQKEKGRLYFSKDFIIFTTFAFFLYRKIIIYIYNIKKKIIKIFIKFLR